MDPDLDITVRPLRERPDLFSFFAEAFAREWPQWYGSGGPGDALADVTSFSNAEGTLPIGVVALQGHHGTPVGIAALKAGSIASRARLTPWIAAGFVVTAFRGRGIGARLIDALLVEAVRLGFPSVYCATATAASLLQRAGWTFVESIDHDGQALQIFRRDVGEAA